MKQNGRRISMENLDIIKLTPDAKKTDQATDTIKERKAKTSNGLLDEEDLFDCISRFQSKRMDDQRATLTISNPNQCHSKQQSAENATAVNKTGSLTFLPGLAKVKQPEMLQRYENTILLIALNYLIKEMVLQVVAGDSTKR